uniref:Myosin motor domain-containing protein n=1 Tax=Strongyloides papillosus TaxID=174720 RepID=A0A0N5BUB5_STREA
MSHIDKQNQLISLLKELHKNNENYIFEDNFLLYLKPSKHDIIKDRLPFNCYDNENDVTNLPPHIYDVARTALIRSLVSKKDVSIILNGGSQSGKTYNIYKCLKYFSKFSLNKNKNFNCDVINSIHLLIRNLCCIDSITEIPLLYKVNISINGISGIELRNVLFNGYNKLICFNENVKNFNIFYTMFYGMDENDKERFNLKNKEFFLLNNTLLDKKEKQLCRNEYNNLKNCMLNILGFTEEHFETFQSIICGILNIGNISFYTDTNSDQKIVKLCQKPEILSITKLLKLEISEIYNIFNYKKYGNNIEKALDLRDGLIEILYKKLIDWVLMRIENIYNDKGNSSIYMFDYKGYTSSGYNEYDEFCTNITNELYMNIFLSKYMEFYLNNNGMVEDDISLTKKTNENCLNILVNDKKNLLTILNDECIFPLTSNSALIQKFDLNFIDQNCYLNSRSIKTFEFGIKHFFGVQYYNVSDFLLQNKRNIYNWIDDIFLKSEDSTIVSMFHVQPDIEERVNQKFVASEIVESLKKNIISKLSKTENIFVFCLKPSLKRNSKEFDCNFITKQLKSQGLLDLLKIKSNNFNHRYHITQFLNEFKILLPNNLMKEQNDNQITNNILINQGSKFTNDYLIVNNIVYLNENLAKQLEWRKYKHFMRCIIKIQALYRGYKARKSFQSKKSATIKIQSYFRGWNARKFIVKKKYEIKEKLMKENDNCKFVAKSKDICIPIGKTTDTYELKLEIEEEYEKIPIKQDILSIIPISIEEFTKKYIKYHKIGVKREVIFAPFLEKENEIDYRESLRVFKIILEFMSSEKISNFFVKNIIETGISNIKLRDEIYIQILNQTYNNSSKKEVDRILILLLVTLNSFLPSPFLFPVLLNYFDSQKSTLQILFTQIFYRHLSISQLQTSRKYSAITTYEMITFSKKQPLCIRINVSGVCMVSIQIDSLSTIKEIVKNCLGKMSIGNVNGWNVDGEFIKNEMIIKLEEKDYIFDIIYMVENDMINIIKNEKFTFPSTMKRPKHNEESSDTFEASQTNGKNIMIDEMGNNVGKRSSFSNDNLLSPRTLRRVYIVEEKNVPERVKIFDDNNNNDISKLDENGNNMECVNMSAKSLEKEIYSPIRYTPILEVDDDVEDLIDNIFNNAISEGNNNMLRSSIEKTLVKNIQGGIENIKEVPTNAFNKQNFYDYHDYETSSSIYNTLSTSKVTPNIDRHSKVEESSMALSMMELQTLVKLGEKKSYISDNIQSDHSKNEGAILVSPKLYNLILRKELFFPCEITDKYEVDLIYLQIINDCKENNPYRIEKKERNAINNILRYNKMSLNDIDMPEKIPFKVKDDIVNCARRWPLYFSRVYYVEKITEKGNEKYQLHVSENGIYIVEIIPNFTHSPYKIIDTISYDEIADTYFEDENIFSIYLYNNINFKFLTSNESEEIRKLVHIYLNPILEKPVYVHAIAPFLSNNNELLSFDKGSQIQIINDNYYHKSTIPNHGNRWLFGKCNNSVGWFSTEYVSMTCTEDDSYVTPYFDHQQVSFPLKSYKSN